MLPKIALLIDAENISHRDLPFIMEEVPRHGRLILRAIYGDWQRPDLQKWYEAAEDHDFKIRHYNSPLKTKNSSDMKLIMDAVEVLYRTRIDVFCLVTNDADYVLLCEKIHDAGRCVIGIGYKHAAETFIRACDKFVFIKPSELIAQPAPPPPNERAVMRKLVIDAFSKAQQDSQGWVSLAVLGSALSQVQPGFQPKNYGHANLSQFLQSMSGVVEFQTNNGSKSVRLRPNPGSKPPKQFSLQKLVSEALTKATKDADGWVGLATLGSVLIQLRSGFQTRHYGHANLSKLLQSMPELVEIQVNGDVKSARLKK